MRKIGAAIGIIAFLGITSFVIWRFFIARDLQARISVDPSPYVQIFPDQNNTQKIVNTKYGYSFIVPLTKEGYRRDDIVSFLYHTQIPPVDWRSISLSLVSFVPEDITAFANSLFINTPVERVQLHGILAYVTEPHVDGSGNTYYIYLLVHPDNLMFALRFETNNFSRDKELFDAVVESFEFTDSVESLPSLQVVEGRVIRVSGNCMPGSGSGCSRFPARTNVYAYPLVRMNTLAQMLPGGAPVAKTTSDWFGNYSLRLPPGSYSMFVESNNEKYCGYGDSFGFACKFTIYKEREIVDIVINNAVY